MAFWLLFEDEARGISPAIPPLIPSCEFSRRDISVLCDPNAAYSSLNSWFELTPTHMGAIHINVSNMSISCILLFKRKETTFFSVFL